MKKRLLMWVCGIAVALSAVSLAAFAEAPKYYVTSGYEVDTSVDGTLSTSGALSDGDFALVRNEAMDLAHGFSFDMKLKVDSAGADVWTKDEARSVGFVLNEEDPSNPDKFKAATSAGVGGRGVQFSFAGMADGGYQDNLYLFVAIGINGQRIDTGNIQINFPKIEHGGEVVRNLYSGALGIRVTVTETAEQYLFRFHALDASNAPQYESIYTAFTLPIEKSAYTFTGKPYLALTAHNDSAKISGEEKANDFKASLYNVKNGLFDLFSITNEQTESAVEVSENNTVQLAAEVTDPIIPGSKPALTYTYASRDAEIAAVSSTGLVTGVKNGETKIAVTSNQGLTVEVPVRILTSKHILEIETPPGKVLVKDASRAENFLLDCKLTENPDSAVPIGEITLAYVSDHPEIASVSETGVVTAEKSGTAVITVTTSQGMSESYTVKVNDGEAPEIVVSPVAAGAEQEKQLTIAKPSVTDNFDGVESLTAKMIAPEYLVFGEVTEDISFTPTAYGSYKVVFTAIDKGGLISESVLTFDVKRKYDKNMDYYFGDTGEGTDATKAFDLDNGVRVLGDIKHGRSRILFDDPIKTQYDLTFDFVLRLGSPDSDMFNPDTQAGIMLNEAPRLSNGKLDYSYFYPVYTGWNGVNAKGVQMVFKQYEKGGPIFFEMFASGTLGNEIVAHPTLREYENGRAVETALDLGKPVSFKSYQDDENKEYVIEFDVYGESGSLSGKPLAFRVPYAQINSDNPDHGFSTQPYLGMISSGYNFDESYHEIPGKYHHVDMSVLNMKNTDVKGILTRDGSATINGDYEIGASGIAYNGCSLPADFKLSYLSSDPEIAAVTDSGNVKPTWKKFGKVTITITSNYGDIAELEITVNAATVEIGEERVEIKAGETFQMTYTVDPPALVPIWKSSNPNIVRVDENGLLTAVKEGQASVTMTVGTEKKTCRVIVLANGSAVGGDGDESDVENSDGTDSSQKQPETGCGAVISAGDSGAGAVGLLLVLLAIPAGFALKRRKNR